MDFLQLHNKTKLAKTADDILSLSQRYSEITLTPKEAYELAAAEASAYNDSGRVFFGESVLPIIDILIFTKQLSSQRASGFFR